MPRKPVPLRISSGWAVVFNIFVEWSREDPADVAEAMSFLSEDILSVEQVRGVGGGRATDPGGTIIDLGWAPNGDIDGEYTLSVLRGGWDGDVVELQHPDWRVVRDALDLTFAKLVGNRSPTEYLAEDFARLSAT